MKRYFSFLLLCLFIGTSYTNEQTYKVVNIVGAYVPTTLAYSRQA